MTRSVIVSSVVTSAVVMFSRLVPTLGRNVSISSDVSDDRISAIVQQNLDEYKLSELKKREGKLVAKLLQTREQITEITTLWEPGRGASLGREKKGRSSSSLTSLSKNSQDGQSSSESNLMVVSSISCTSISSDIGLEEAAQSPEPVQNQGILLPDEINEQDAKIWEKNIIEFETMSQEEEEGLEEFVTRLQHKVVAAYGNEGTETLQRRVAWAFIRGCRDPNVRCHVVSEGWTKSHSETLTPGELLDLALAVLLLFLISCTYCFTLLQTVPYFCFKFHLLFILVSLTNFGLFTSSSYLRCIQYCLFDYLYWSLAVLYVLAFNYS